MKKLQGKVAIVTGASAGLGRATALALAAEGASVVVTARREERLRLLVDEIGEAAAFVAGDASLESTAEEVLAAALQRFGRIDILINNAGQGNYKQLVDTTAAEYDEMMAANVRSGFVFSRAVAPHMIAQNSGQIVFISSVAGLSGAANESVYCASKFAQLGFAQALDAELRPHGIKVTALCPGGIKTEFAVGHGRTEESVAQSRMMDARELAETIVFTCSLPPNLRVPQMTIRHMG
ncbi:SDR family oxidoreductase [Terriglobus saanensis]|uniref:Short-chain dehydrogenase/reductase SDR n=1 Tax=Terriglobus saanensis (strain ATCC BAA-1853 / DSM 23119 / SP1PR4) TaxID=401053 RepID=E8V8P6_TERSS|nr:SDR family oxidoreductase [Terriglobus saanensis]ADV84083.1 short-chain dehydrogenase/reductase SDR [Terriglobus saanensis SP1PR4]